MILILVCGGGQSKDRSPQKVKSERSVSPAKNISAPVITEKMIAHHIIVENEALKVLTELTGKRIRNTQQLTEAVKEIVEKNNKLEDTIYSQKEILQQQKIQNTQNIQKVDSVENSANIDNSKYSQMEEMINDYALMPRFEAAKLELERAIKEAIKNKSSIVKLVAKNNEVEGELTPRRINKLQSLLEKNRKEVQQDNERVQKQTEQIERNHKEQMEKAREIFSNLSEHSKKQI